MVVLALTVVGCASVEPHSLSTPGGGAPDLRRAKLADDGLLVMAHGGTEEWNVSVREAVAPLEPERPTRIAFGMADPVTLQQAINQLESAGVRRIAVVRLFVSGESFLERTEFLLGKRFDPPHHGGAGGTLSPLETSSVIELDREGLIDGREVAAIVQQRAERLSVDPGAEAVLLIGHGSGDESVNARIIKGMEVAAESVREKGFAEVQVETLQEDWREQRQRAEHRIRDWVADRGAAGYRVLVIPFRLSGFGPYADVLKGLDYEADGLGLLPHPEITEWIRQRAATLLGTETSTASER